MKFLSIFVVLSSLFTLSSHASLVSARVVKIIPGETRNEETLILLHDGQVLRTTNPKTIEAMTTASASHETFSFVESNQKILTFTKLDADSPNPIVTEYFDNTLPSFTVSTNPTTVRYTDMNFIPTNLNSMSDAQRLMDPLKVNSKSASECYQRAHLWAFEMNQMANINSQKVFVFFTTKYMREYRFHWWFHVAPFVLVNDQEYVVDQSFFDQPADMQTWTNYFMPSHPVCKTVSNYDDYDNHQEDEYCYLRKLPMYYFEPTEVANRDESQTIISDWIEDQVASAYASLSTAPWWKR